MQVRSLTPTGFVVPPGWYGFIPAAGIGIIRRAQVPDNEGYAALQALGAPDEESRSHEFEGRRLVRVDGGFVVLNFMKFRDRDYGGAARWKHWRDRQKVTNETRDDRDVTRDATDGTGDVTQAEAEANESNSNSVSGDADAKKRKVERRRTRQGVDEAVDVIAKSDPTFQADDVRHAIAEQLAAEVRNGVSLEDLIERMPAMWRKFSAARDSGKFEIRGWGPANFFGGGHWRERTVLALVTMPPRSAILTSGANRSRFWENLDQQVRIPCRLV